MLAFSGGEPFATGAVPYRYAPTEMDMTPRLLLEVKFEGIRTTAVVDTGAPYVVCEPTVARLLTLPATFELERVSMLIRGLRISGSLHRLTITFPASEGEPLDVDATVFIPQSQSEDGWGSLPSFVGLTGGLDRMRFAVDSSTETFYFGPQW